MKNLILEQKFLEHFTFETKILGTIYLWDRNFRDTLPLDLKFLRQVSWLCEEYYSLKFSIGTQIFGTGFPWDKYIETGSYWYKNFWDSFLLRQKVLGKNTKGQNGFGTFFFWENFPNFETKCHWDRMSLRHFTERHFT